MNCCGKNVNIVYSRALCDDSSRFPTGLVTAKKKANTLFLRSQCASHCQLQMRKVASVPPATFPASVFQVRGERRIYKGGIFCFAIQKTASGFPTNIAQDPETRSSVAPNERRTGLARRKPANDRAPQDDAAGPRIHLYI